MSKKVKINGQWVSVKDEEVKDDPEGGAAAGEGADEGEEAPTAPDASAAPEAPVAPAAAADEGETDLSDDEKAALEIQAKAMGKNIAKSVMSGMGLDEKKIEKLQKSVDSVLSLHQTQDAKLMKILNGKDYVKDAASLTKEEKIVGFYHALVTDNKVALKALSEGTDADGGFLFPNEFLGELVRELPNINVMRNWIRIIPMKRDAMDITNLISGPEVTWTAENVAKSTTTARFSRLTLTAYKVAAILYSSDELIEDSDIFDVVSMIISLFAEAIADEEERVIWVGDNTTQPQGINAAGTIATVAAVGQDHDDIIRLYHALPRKYRVNAAFFMNDTTAQNVALLKDSQNRPLWQPAIADGENDRLRGKPVVISDWVPDNSIFFGDMKKCYYLGDRKRMTVKISQDTTQAFTQDMTAIRVVSRIGGIVAQPLAARELTGF